jgi:hypothetical protein
MVRENILTVEENNLTVQENNSALRENKSKNKALSLGYQAFIPSIHAQSYKF